MFRFASCLLAVSHFTVTALSTLFDCKKGKIEKKNTCKIKTIIFSINNTTILRTSKKLTLLSLVIHSKNHELIVFSIFTSKPTIFRINVCDLLDLYWLMDTNTPSFVPRVHHYRQPKCWIEWGERGIKEKRVEREREEQGRVRKKRKGCWMDGVERWDKVEWKEYREKGERE